MDSSSKGKVKGFAYLRRLPDELQVQRVPVACSSSSNQVTVTAMVNLANWFDNKKAPKPTHVQKYLTIWTSFY